MGARQAQGEHEPMMSCEQITRAADDFVERQLRVRDRLMVLVHVAMCKGCRAYLEQFRQTLLGLRALPLPVAAPPSEDLILLFRRHLRGRE
jgi:predicted anti-sigma-YlaC factor YlaD